MVERALQHAARHPLRFGARLLCVAVVAAMVASNAIDGVRLLWFKAELARVSAVERRPATGEVVDVSWGFPFGRNRLVVNVSVDRADLEAAASLDTSVVFGSTGWLRDSCIAALVRAQSESRVIDALADGFRSIRSRLDLDDDEYLEMLATAVQRMPYGNASGELQLPAETLVLGRGVCTDRCVLLGSLLLHEGYDTAVWVFTRPNHVALGVASNGATFRGTRYAFLETTAPRFVGQVGAECRAQGPVSPAPHVIELGGWRSYTAGPEVEAILATLARTAQVKRMFERYEALVPRSGPMPARFVEHTTALWVADSIATFVGARTHQRREVYAMLRGVEGAVGPGDAELAE